MKRFLLLISTLLISFYSFSQECKTYTLHYDLNEEMEYFCSLDPIAGEVSKLNFIPDVQYIQHGFSGINPIQGAYYFYGIDNNYNGVLYTMDLVDGNISNAIDFPTNEINGNIIEMHYHPFNELVYALHWDNTENMEYLISFSPTTGEITKIDSIPEVQMVQVDYSALDYTKDEFYFMGVDSENNFRLYTIDINTGEVLHNPITPSENINGNLNELEVDIYRGNLYSLHYNQQTNTEYFVSIDKETGNVNLLSSIADVQYIQAGFSAINAIDGQYYFHGIDSNNLGKLYTIDMYTGAMLNAVEIYGDNLFGGLNELQFPSLEPVPLAMNQTAICNQDSALVLAPQDFENYLWSNGSSENHTYIQDSSDYSVILTKDYGCEVTIQPLQVEVYNCDDYIESLVQMHDSCLFEPEHIAMSYINDVQYNYEEVSLVWNFISAHSDTISVNSQYEVSENGLYEVMIGFNCSEKSDEVLYSNMIQVDHLNPTSISTNSLSNLSFYPNPVKDVLNLRFDDLSFQNLSLKIINTSNKIVYEQKLSSIHEQIQVNQLSAGIYFAILENSEYSETFKFIKTK